MATVPRPAGPPIGPFAASSDPDLVRSIATGDHRALEEIHRRHGGAVFGLSRRVLADEALAEEVSQEVFLRLWTEPHRFDAGRGSLRSFLQRQAHSRAIERVRSEEARRNREERAERIEVRTVTDIEAEVVATLRSDAVRAALATLDPVERHPIVLAYFGGHSYREVAVMLDAPEGTVKSRIRSGLNRLADQLESVGGGAAR
ncbi:MAG: sigma-70 family RNA polymerase sigma factor [Actinobacteria bacterium]|nr:sigma-70 family RNA polymerase sigma factor [Actinomycetota bacterium]